MATKQKVTIKDVAKAAGYSTYTVSSVLNNKGDIGQAASEKIRNVARELNYGILGTESAAKRMTSQSLGIVLPDSNCLQVGFYNRAVSSFRTVASERDLDCKLFTEQDIIKRTGPHKTISLSMLGCKGLVIFCPWLDYHEYLRPLMEHGIATALIRRAHPRTPGLILLRDNEQEGMQLLLQHLYNNRGCRRMAFISSHKPSSQYLRGWDIAFKKFSSENLSSADTLMLSEAPGADSQNYQQLEAFIRSAPKQRTAITTWSDTCAARVLSNMQMRGLRAPTDFLIAGYNNDPISLDTSPELTTMHIPVEEMVSAACDYLLSYVEEGNLPAPKQITFTHRLILRGSTEG